MSKFLSLDETSAFAMTTCKGATAEDRHLFRVWIVAACKDIGPNRDWVKTEVIYPNDFSFKKPNDHVSTISIALYNYTNGEVIYRFNHGSKRIKTDRFSINEEDATYSNIVDLGEDANYFHMSSNAVDVACMMLRYLGMPVDQEGFPLIPEEDLLAYEAFCRWMWAKREDDNRSKIDQDYSFWVRERDRVKGKRKMPTIREAEAIFSKYMSLLPQPIPPNF